MQSTSNVASDKLGKTGIEKVTEKLAEKRRALGRGLESLLPGPRVVPGTETGRAGTHVAPPAARHEHGDATTTVAPTPGGREQGALATAGGTPALPDVSPSGDGAKAGVDLQPAAARRTADGEEVHELPLKVIRDNPNQTRQTFEKEHLEEMAASIAVQGVMQPVVVRPAGDGAYFLIMGERRLRASQIAGKTTIPAIIKRVSEQQAAEMTITENLQRQDLDCIEQAGAFSMLSLRFHMTQEEIGKRVGVSRESVANYLRLLKLPAAVIRSIQHKELSFSHARLLLRLASDEQISKVARLAIDKAMSVQQLEDEVERLTMPGAAKESEPAQASGARWVDPNVRAAQRSLEMVLGMRVRIRDRKGKGKITIEYGTLEDFDRVVNMLKGK
jgi:ParB family chromosome partitioning protein